MSEDKQQTIVAANRNVAWQIQVFGAITLLSAFVATVFNIWYLMVFPAFVLVLYLAVVDLRVIFFCLMALTPLSIEVELGSLGTDLPTEPLTIGLMIAFWLILLNRWADKSFSESFGRFLRHPLVILMGLYFAWTIITTLYSVDFTRSLKHTLSKFWYISTFFLLVGILFREIKTVKTLFWCVFPTLMLTVVVSLIRHGLTGFDFEKVTPSVVPYYRNHVSYACFLSLFVPFLLLARTWYRQGSRQRWWLGVAFIILLIGIQFSYTRTAYVALFGAIGYYIVIRLHLTRLVTAFGLVILVLGLTYLANGNKYLDYAPNFQKTITQKDFNSLVSATYELKDISTMERVCRWVAGFRMVQERPLLGFGSNTFYVAYKPYMVSSFQTYVSDNKEQSTVHCYYLLEAAERGVIGFLLFLGICLGALVVIENVYYRYPLQPAMQNMILAIGASFLIILILNMVNDLIETDKIGSFFYINLALIINMDLASRHHFSSSIPT